jgi:hypothetical protein
MDKKETKEISKNELITLLMITASIPIFIKFYVEISKYIKNPNNHVSEDQVIVKLFLKNQLFFDIGFALLISLIAFLLIKVYSKINFSIKI